MLSEYFCFPLEKAATSGNMSERMRCSAHSGPDKGEVLLSSSTCKRMSYYS